MTNEYRVKVHPNGFEPQMLYNTGLTEDMIWFPLDAKGCWLEPEAFTYGNITQHLLFDSQEDAERVIIRAKSINGENVKVL